MRVGGATSPTTSRSPSPPIHAYRRRAISSRSLRRVAPPTSTIRDPFKRDETTGAEIPGPLLYSLPGFRYCDLLLAAAEHAAFLDCGSLLPLSASQPAASAGGQTTDEHSTSGDVLSRPDASRLAGESGSRLPQSKALRDVAQRATQTLKWVETQNWLLTIALDHLTLGRAALYAAILDESEISNLKSEIEKAVSGLRRAGQQHMLVLGLLTRAWLRSLTPARTGPESAQSDLDEAWEIAARGPMPLFMADIHLYRARLFGKPVGKPRAESGKPGEQRDARYPWGSVEEDLGEARRLIEKCGYGRRKEELEDAERVLLGERHSS